MSGRRKDLRRASWRRRRDPHEVLRRLAARTIEATERFHAIGRAAERSARTYRDLGEARARANGPQRYGRNVKR